MFDRRSVIGSGAALAGLAVTSSATAVSHSASPEPMGVMMFDECIDKCLASSRRCLETATYVIGQDHTSASSQRIVVLLDCAELCQVTANSMLRKSSQHALLCDACARLCENCAAACLEQGSDAVMRTCAETCRDCAQSCRDTVSMRM